MGNHNCGFSTFGTKEMDTLHAQDEGEEGEEEA